MSDKLLEIKVRHSLQTANGILPMDIATTVAAGSIAAVTGPSGAGKTTFLRQIAGLSTPYAGYIRFGDDLWLDSSKKILVPPQKRKVGFVFQDYGLFPHMTVRQNLMFAFEKEGDPDIVEHLLLSVELTELADRKPHQLSGGQQQRVALARALVQKPELLLLDEPLAALDHTMRIKLQDYLLECQRRLGFVMVFVSHDLAEIFRLAHQVIVIENGQIVKEGTPQEVYLHQKNNEASLALYAQVLATEVTDGHLIVTALVQQNIRTLKLPLLWQDELKPGQAFSLRYDAQTADIQLIR